MARVKVEFLFVSWNLSHIHCSGALPPPYIGSPGKALYHSNAGQLKSLLKNCAATI